MNEKQFVVLCFAVSILGILVMFIANRNLEPENVNISQITIDKKYVAFNATIISIKKTETATFIKTKDETGIIDLVVFGERLNISNLKTGMNVKVVGKTQKYKEKIEILPLKIIV
jgi:DNA/RNA endonuclease YhcR with UshA esterase domain